MKDVMKNPERMTEEIERRILYLKFRKKLLLLPLFVAAGILLCGLLYQGYRMAAKEPRYQQVSKLYIDFARDDAGKPADYFNGATWTDLLTAHPGIWGKAEGRLSEALPGLARTDGALKDFIRDTVNAEIISDVRLLTVTVTTADPSLTGQVSEIIDGALVSFGSEAKEFERISFLSADPVKQTVLDNRMRNALLLGAFLGLLAGVFYLWFAAIMDNSVCTPEEAQRAFGLPVLGMTFSEKKTGADKDAAGPDSGRPDGQFAEEMRDNLSLFLSNQDVPVYLVSPLGKERAEAMCDAIAGGAAGIPDETLSRISAASGDAYETLRGGLVCLALPYGISCRTAAQHLADQLGKQGCPVRALFLQDADPSFIARYYDIKGTL